MCASTKRTRVYLDSAMQKELQQMADKTSRSVSDLVNEAVRNFLAEDAEDLAAFEERINEPLVTFEVLLKELKTADRL